MFIAGVALGIAAATFFWIVILCSAHDRLEEANKQLTVYRNASVYDPIEKGA